MSDRVQQGDIIAGKYRVERTLGAGGMGFVIAALHMELAELVAIKLLLPEALAKPEVVERFSREARAAVKIKSEHVARVIDVGKLESGTPYIVMEYLAGEDLSRLLERQGPLPIPEAVEYILQASEAIAEAHALGIVHRDLKPANLFLTHRADGAASIKVLDFGISKAPPELSGPEGSLTRTATVIGSPQYMSPEQMRSIKNADLRSDVWGLGAILYELISGKAVFQAETMPELCVKIMTVEPPSLSEVWPTVPRRLDALVGRCLDKAPERRFQSIAELATALAPFAPKRAHVSIDRIRAVHELGARTAGPPSARTAGPPSARPPVPPQAREGARAHSALPPATVAGWGLTPRLPLHGARGPILGAALGLVLIVAGLYFGLRGSPDAPGSGSSRSAAPDASSAISALPLSPKPEQASAAPPGPPAPAVVLASPAQSATEEPHRAAAPSAAAVGTSGPKTTAPATPPKAAASPETSLPPRPGLFDEQK